MSRSYYIFDPIPPEVAHFEILPKFDAGSRIMLRRALGYQYPKKISQDDQVSILKGPSSIIKIANKERLIEHDAVLEVKDMFPQSITLWLDKQLKQKSKYCSVFNGEPVDCVEEGGTLIELTRYYLEKVWLEPNGFKHLVETAGHHVACPGLIYSKRCHCGSFKGFFWRTKFLLLHAAVLMNNVELTKEIIRYHIGSRGWQDYTYTLALLECG